MTPFMVAWVDVFPWARVLDPGDHGAVWYVVPTHPMFPRIVTQTPHHRDPRTERVLPVGPNDLVTVLVSDEFEALATLRDQFRTVELMGQRVTPLLWHCPAVMTHWQLGRHLNDFHSVSLGSLGRLSEFETHRWHNGLHQQVSMWPLPVAHIHTPEVSA